MTYETVTESLCDGNKRLLFVRTVTPLIEEQPLIEEFYRDLAVCCRAFCRENLLAHLSSRGGEASVFGFLYRYTMHVAVTYADEAYLACRLSVTLRRESDGRRLMSVGDGQVFSLADGRILPPGKVLRLFGDRQVRKTCHPSRGALLPENGYLKQWQDGIWQTVGPLRGEEVTV